MELGVVAAAGVAKVAALVEIVRDEADGRLPKAARFALAEIAAQIEALTRQIDRLDREIVAEAKRDADMRRLATIPGVGAITAASVKALVPDPDGFKSGRHFAAWLGLTPKPHSSGGKERLGGISKMGNPMLRSLLVLGASAVLRHVKNKANGRMAVRAFGATALQGRRDRARQQDGAGHMGAADQGGSLIETWTLWTAPSTPEQTRT